MIQTVQSNLRVLEGLKQKREIKNGNLGVRNEVPEANQPPSDWMIRSGPEPKRNQTKTLKLKSEFLLFSTDKQSNATSK